MHGDDFSPLLPIDGDTPALLDRSVDELVAHARQRAEELHIGPTDRVLSTLEWTLPDGVVDGLLAVLAGKSSLVHCTNLDPAKREARRDTERTTVELGD